MVSCRTYRTLCKCKHPLNCLGLAISADLEDLAQANKVLSTTAFPLLLLDLLEGYLHPKTATEQGKVGQQSNLTEAALIIAQAYINGSILDEPIDLYSADMVSHVGHMHRKDCKVSRGRLASYSISHCSDSFIA